MHTRAHYCSCIRASTHARTRDGRQVGPRTSKRSAGAPERRRVPRCRLIYGPPRPFFPSFLSRGPPRSAALSVFSSPSFVPPPSLSLSFFLSTFRTVYSVCVAHVSHGICYVVHGISAAAADRLIRGPAPPLAFFSFGSLDILISPSRFSRIPFTSSLIVRAHTRVQKPQSGHRLASRRVRHACVRPR